MAKAKPTTTQKSDQQLGTLIAKVLDHPDLPEDVFTTSFTQSVKAVYGVPSVH